MNKKRYSKRVLSLVLSVLMIVSIIPIGMVQASAATTAPPIGDEQIRKNINTLICALNGRYFTLNQSYCKAAPGEGGHPNGWDCSNCDVKQVIQTTWLSNALPRVPSSGDLLPSQFNYNGVRWGNGGYSCYGFANFALWFVYSQKSTDDVYSDLLGICNISCTVRL